MHEIIEHEGQQPTCLIGGWKAYETCASCDYSTYEALAPLGHLAGEAVKENQVDSSCVASGCYEEAIYCTRCETELSRSVKTIDPLGHSYVDHASKEATCLEAGWKAYQTCSRCDYSTYEEIPAKGHDYEKSASVVKGETLVTYTCSRCGVSYGEECKVTSCGQFVIDYEHYQYPTLTRTVPSAESSIAMSSLIKVSKGCSWSLSRDIEGLETIKTKNMSLNYGHNYAYVTVWYGQEEYNTVYYVDVYRLREYQVSFVSFDGTSSTKAYDEGDYVEAPSPLEQEGHTFYGWTLDGSNSVSFPYVVSGDLIFRPLMSVNSYTITFDSDGGSEVSPMSVEYGAIISAPEPTREGYTFKGWSGLPSSMPASDLRVTALWEINYYWLTFEDASMEPMYLAYQAEVSVPEDPVREGYTFTGWDKEIPSFMPAEDLTIKAEWTIHRYSIVFDVDGGSPIDAITQDYGTEVNKPDDPSKEGYTFVGWDKEIPSTMPASNLTIKAMWQINQYTIEFKLDDENVYSSNTLDYGTAINVPQDPVKEGYTFLGWSEEIPSTMPASDLAFTARWQINRYTATFLVDGEEYFKTTQDYGTELSAPSAPSKEGYTFTGWDKEVPSSMPAGDSSYSGALEINRYTLTFDTQGGSAVDPIIQDYGTEITKPADPTRTGYSFTGWSEEIPSTMPAENRTFRACWTPITYSISYDAGKGTNPSSNPTSYTIESSTIVLAEATRENYEFIGWSNGTEVITSIPQGSYGDLPLKAVWAGAKFELSIASSDASRGTVSVAGEGRYEESVTVEATPTDGYLFAGWYIGDALVSEANPYTFTMPASDYSFTAKFLTEEEKEEEKRLQALGIVSVIDSTNNTLTYGLYPQAHVSDTDTATLAALNALTDDDADSSNGWYLLNGEYYAKASASPYQSDYVFDDGTKIVSRTTYWFKCEPITWKILSSSNGEYSLVSTVLLDAHRYNAYWENADSDGYYANNYERSEIRAWLNGDFYNKAFSIGNSIIQTTAVDNSASTTDSSSNSYACNDTEDKVYLLSYKDYLNADYGFSTSSSAYDAARRCKTTDWARANGARYSTSSSYLYDGYYWTRSPYSSKSPNAWSVCTNGVLGGVRCPVHSSYSVRPSLRIKVAQ